MLKILMVLMVLWAMPAYAQYDGAVNRDPQAPVDLPHYAGSLSDFTYMQTLCKSDVSGDYLSTSICTLVDNEARSGAHKARIKLVNTAGPEDEKTFTLFVHVASAGRVPRAVSIRVEASRFYEGAMDKRAFHDSAAAYPRQGKMIFYEETITGVGSDETLEEAMRGRLREVLRNFFNQFDK